MGGSKPKSRPLPPPPPPPQEDFDQPGTDEQRRLRANLRGNVNRRSTILTSESTLGAPAGKVKSLLGA